MPKLSWLHAYLFVVYVYVGFKHIDQPTDRHTYVRTYVRTHVSQSVKQLGSLTVHEFCPAFAKLALEFVCGGSIPGVMCPGHGDYFTHLQYAMQCSGSGNGNGNGNGMQHG